MWNRQTTRGEFSLQHFFRRVSITGVALTILWQATRLPAEDVSAPREWNTESASEVAFRELLHAAQTNGTADTVIHIRHAIPISGTVELWWPGPGRVTLDGGKTGRLLAQNCAAGQDALAIGGPDLVIRGLAIIGSGGWALRIGGSGRYCVEGCEFSEARGGGLVVWNEQAVPRAGVGQVRSLVRGNLVQQFNRSNQQWLNDGISVADDDVDIVGNTVRDCQAETMGIRVMGRRHRVEWNRIERVGHTDSGGIYLWGGERVYECLGHEVCHNFIADISRGIYLDDATSGVSVHDNAIFRAQVAGIFIGGGRDNRVTTDLVVQSPIGVHLDNRTVGWKDQPGKLDLWAAARARLARVLEEKGSSAQRLRESFPQLRNLSPADCGVNYTRPENNLIRDNVLASVPTEFRPQDYTLRTPPNYAFTNWNQITSGRILEPGQASESDFAAARLNQIHTSAQTGHQAFPAHETPPPSPSK